MGGGGGGAGSRQTEGWEGCQRGSQLVQSCQSSARTTMTESERHLCEQSHTTGLIRPLPSELPL